MMNWLRRVFRVRTEWDIFVAPDGKPGIIERTRHVLFASPEGVEFIAGMVWLVIGSTLLFGSGAWCCILANNPAYRVLASFLSEDAAGALFIVIGLSILWTLFFGPIYSRRLAMILSAGLYTVFTALFVLSGPTTATSYGVLAMACTWCYIRLGNRR